MVARISLGRNILGLLYYNEEKVRSGKAKVIAAHGFGAGGERASIREKHRRFSFYTDKNPRAKLNAFHVSLNFSPKDRLDEDQLRYIAQEYMVRIGFGGQPYLLYQHFDAGHQHVHLVSTNITREGKRIETHNLGREKSEKARKGLEEELGLVKAEEQKEQRLGIRPLEKVEYGKRESKAAMGNVITEVMRTYAFSSLGEFNAILGQFNIGLIQGEEGSRMKRHKGLSYSILDEKGKRIGVPIKASAFYASPTYSRLQKRMERNQNARKKLIPQTREKVATVLKISKGKGIQEFRDNLKKEGLAAGFHYTKEGKVYGLTFIDHINRAAFKASDLSRSFSGQKLVGELMGDKANNKTVKAKNFPTTCAKGPVGRNRGRSGPGSQMPVWKAEKNPVLLGFLGAMEEFLRPELQERADPFERRKKKRKRRKIN